MVKLVEIFPLFCERKYYIIIAREEKNEEVYKQGNSIVYNDSNGINHVSSSIICQ